MLISHILAWLTKWSSTSGWNPSLNFIDFILLPFFLFYHPLHFSPRVVPCHYINIKYSFIINSFYFYYYFLFIYYYYYLFHYLFYFTFIYCFVIVSYPWWRLSRLLPVGVIFFSAFGLPSDCNTSCIVSSCAGFHFFFADGELSSSAGCSVDGFYLNEIECSYVCALLCFTFNNDDCFIDSARSIL